MGRRGVVRRSDKGGIFKEEEVKRWSIIEPRVKTAGIITKRETTDRLTYAVKGTIQHDAK